MGFKPPAPSAGSSVPSIVGAYQIVKPSGDATGAGDRTAINAALATGDVWLTGDFVVDTTVLIPSTRTLILADAKITNANNVLKPVVGNAQWNTGAGNTGNTDIFIRGIGRAIIDHNGANNAEQTAALYKSCCLTMVNVNRFAVTDVQVQNSTYVGVMLQACVNGRVRGLHMDKGTDLGYIHVSSGSSNVVVEGMTASGVFADSVITVASVQGNWYSTPYAATLTGSQLACAGISFRSVTVASTQNMVNLLVDGNAGVTNCTFDDFHNTHTGAAAVALPNEFWFGPSGYQGPTGQTLSNPANGAINGIRISNYTTGTATIFLKIDAPIQDVHVSGVRYTSTQAAQQFISYDRAIPSGLYPQMTRLKISDVDIPWLGQPLMQMQAGWRISDLSLENVHIGACSAAILKNSSDVTGLALSRFRIGTLNAVPFQSTATETGVVRDFQYQTKGTSLTALCANAPGFRIEQPFPSIASGDVTPLPVHGSEINCYPGKDPTGGAATTGGKYIADGQSWSLISSLNGVFRPQQFYTPLLFHYDARTLLSLGLADGGAVSKWPDVGGTGVALTQATSANQPTFVASDATLNNRPAVKFDGVNDYLQNTLLQTVAAAQPFTVFIVYYWNNPLTGSLVFDGASANGGSGSDGVLVYRPSNLMIYAGTGNVGNLTVAAATAYVMVAAVNGNAGYLGLNKAAFPANAGTAGTRTLTGITLGQSYNATGAAGGVTIAEVMAFPKFMTAEYATIAAGLAAKYAITLA